MEETGQIQKETDQMQKETDQIQNETDQIQNETDQVQEETDQITEPKTKIKKPGIIYISYIPKGMNVTKVRGYFSEFGEVRRIYLTPGGNRKPGKPIIRFKEGWVEFRKRRIARQVAEFLNGKPVGGKRHTPYHDALWSLKYLPGLQWNQLGEKQANQQAQKAQRMRAEISQVKQEINAYAQAANKMQRNKRIKGSNEEMGDNDTTSADMITNNSGSGKTFDKPFKQNTDDVSEKNKSVFLDIFNR